LVGISRRTSCNIKPRRNAGHTAFSQPERRTPAGTRTDPAHWLEKSLSSLLRPPYLDVYERQFDVSNKMTARHSADADRAAHGVIAARLALRDIPVLSEESARIRPAPAGSASGWSIRSTVPRSL
jgi:hypothetical protein